MPNLILSKMAKQPSKWSKYNIDNFLWLVHMAPSLEHVAGLGLGQQSVVTRATLRPGAISVGSQQSADCTRSGWSELGWLETPVQSLGQR